MRRKEPSLVELGKRIKEVRLSLELTQDQLEDFGINYKHYQDIERGAVNSTYLTLLKIAGAFKCSVKDFLE